MDVGARHWLRRRKTVGVRNSRQRASERLVGQAKAEYGIDDQLRPDKGAPQRHIILILARCSTKDEFHNGFAKEAQQPSTEYAHIVGLAFPDCHNLPPKPTKPLDALSVALYVPSEFQTPVAHSGLWSPSIPAPVVMMPKTAVYKDDFPPSGKN